MVAADEQTRASLLLLGFLHPHTGRALDDEDDPFADVGGMITYALKLVGDPEKVGCTLQNEGVLLQGWDGSCSCEHGH